MFADDIGLQVQEKEALAQKNEALNRQLQQLSSQASMSEPPTSPVLKPAAPAAAQSPLETAVVHAAQAAALTQDSKPKKITSASIIGTSDKVQASLQELQTQLRATCECLGVTSQVEAAVQETRTLCTLLRRRLMKTVGSRALEMDATLQRVLDWSDESQVRLCLMYTLGCMQHGFSMH